MLVYLTGRANIGLARTLRGDVRGGAGESGRERVGGPGLRWVVDKRARRRRPRGGGCRRTLRGCGLSVGSRAIGRTMTGLVTRGMRRGGAASIGGFLVKDIRLASLDAASDRRDVLGFARQIGSFRSTCPSLPRITAVYMCPYFTRVIDRSLRMRKIRITYMSNDFPSSRTLVRIGMTRATLTVGSNTARVSVILSINGFLDKSCRATYSRVDRLGTIYKRHGLGMVLRAKYLGATTGVGGTSLLTVCTKTSCVGASANGLRPTTAPRTTCIVYRTVGRCCSRANVRVKFGPTKNVDAIRSTLMCCAVMGRILNRG